MFYDSYFATINTCGAADFMRVKSQESWRLENFSILVHNAVNSLSCKPSAACLNIMQLSCVSLAISQRSCKSRINARLPFLGLLNKDFIILSGSLFLSSEYLEIKGFNSSTICCDHEAC